VGNSGWDIWPSAVSNPIDVRTSAVAFRKVSSLLSAHASRQFFPEERRLLMGVEGGLAH